MKRQIQLYKRIVEYTLKISSRSQKMTLAVYQDGEFVVTVPQYATQNALEDFITRKSKWILDKIDHSSKTIPRPTNIFAKNSRTEYIKYKEQARIRTQRKILDFNALYGFTYSRIAIKNMKTRWGSCSKKGNLNFSYKIALLPEPLADYLVVHELCHLGQFNHSQKFWNLVAKAIPDYKERRKELRAILFR